MVRSSSCPVKVGPPPDSPLAEAILTLGDLKVRVRDYGPQPGPNCFAGLIGVTVFAGEARQQLELSVKGQSGKRYPFVVPPMGDNEVQVSFTVPKSERMVEATLKIGLKQVTRPMAGT